MSEKPQRKANEKETAQDAILLRRHAVGLFDFDELNPFAEINSPRSRRACAALGILPDELVHKPADLFFIAGVSHDVAKLRFDFAECWRLDLLEGARRKYDEIESRLSRGEPLFVDGVGSLEKRMEFENTAAFFREQLEDIKPELVSSVSPKKVEGRGCPYIEKAYRIGDSHDPRPDLVPRSTSAPRIMSPTLGRTVRESVPLVAQRVEQLRSAPRANRIEIDAATVITNNLGTKLIRDEKERLDNNQKVLGLVEKRLSTSLDNFKKLYLRQEMECSMAEFRHEMALPRSQQNQGRLPSFVRADRTRERLFHDIATRELKWSDYLDSVTRNDHARKARWLDNLNMTKMKFSNQSMNDRIRWRYHYDVVLSNKEAFYDDLVRSHLQREEDLENRKRRESNTSYMRSELKRLREVGRKMEEHRRQRKLNYEKEMKESQIHAKREVWSEELRKELEAGVTHSVTLTSDFDPLRPTGEGVLPARSMLPALARRQALSHAPIQVA